ncbi:MAG: DUF488 domain-containing protein [Actinomycetota bacterium]
MLKLKRAYEEPSRNDGYRVLVDRLWPRGVKKEDAKLDRWLKDIAPSDELRKWYGHDVERWKEFKNRYFKELKERDELLKEIMEKAGGGTVTLVYGAKDEEHNNAAALREYLQERMD